MRKPELTSSDLLFILEWSDDEKIRTKAALLAAEKYLVNGDYWQILEMRKNYALPEEINRRLLEKAEEAANATIVERVALGHYERLRELARRSELSETTRRNAEERIGDAIKVRLENTVEKGYFYSENWRSGDWFDGIAGEEEFPEELKGKIEDYRTRAAMRSIAEEVESGHYKGVICIAKADILSDKVRQEAQSKIGAAAAKAVSHYMEGKKGVTEGRSREIIDILSDQNLPLETRIELGYTTIEGAIEKAQYGLVKSIAYANDTKDFLPHQIRDRARDSLERAAMSLVECYRKMGNMYDPEWFKRLIELTKDANFPSNAKKQAEQYVREGIAELAESL